MTEINPEIKRYAEIVEAKDKRIARLEMLLETIANSYYIMIGKTYKIHKKVIFIGRERVNYYHITIKINDKFANKTVYFPKGKEVEDGTYITIYDMKEYPTQDRKNQYKYNWGITITDYKIVKQDITKELDKYHEKINNQELNFNNKEYIDSIIKFDD